MNIKNFVENYLSDDARLYIFGLGPGVAQRLKDNLDYEYKDILRPNEEVTERDLEENMKEIQRNAAVAKGVAMGSFFSGFTLSEQFRYSTLPGVQAASNTIDGYGKFIGDVLQKKEELQHSYGMAARTAFNVAVAAPSLIRTGMTVARGVRSGMGIMRAAGTALALPTDPLTVLVGVGILAATYVIDKLVYSAVVSLTEERALRLAMQAAAVHLVNTNLVTDDYSRYRHSRLMGDVGGDNAYSAMNTMLTNQYSGVSAEMFGYNYEDMSGLLGNMARSGIMTDSNYRDYAERSLQFSGLYGRDMSGTMSSLSRITRGGEIDEATDLFETFFSSLVVDGRLHLSQAGLVEEMTGFSESYIMGNRLNTDTGAMKNFARIHQMVSPIYGDKQTTLPTQNLVRGVDSVLQQGAFGGNMHISTMMGRTGITRGQALMGVTSDPKVFEKFLHGIYLELGIGGSEFDEEGNLNDEDMQRYMAYTQYGLGMDLDTSRATFAAYRGFAQGARGEDVNTLYSENLTEDLSEGLAGTGMAKLIVNWTRGSRILTDVTFSHSDVLMGLNEAVMGFTKRTIPSILYDITDVFDAASGRLDSAPTTGSRVRPTTSTPSSSPTETSPYTPGGAAALSFSAGRTFGAWAPAPGNTWGDSVPESSVLIVSRAMDFMRSSGYGFRDPRLFYGEDYESKAANRATIRNLNPGALRWAGQLGASSSEGGAWARFNTMETGFQAMINQIYLYASGKSSHPGSGTHITLSDMIHMYAPVGSDQNQTTVNNYVSAVVESMKDFGYAVSPETNIMSLITHDYRAIMFLALSMAIHEMGADIAEDLLIGPGGGYFNTPSSSDENTSGSGVNGNSQITETYVSIDIELNGYDSQSVANYLKNSFVRA